MVLLARKIQTMKFQLDNGGSGYSISSYSPGRITVNEEVLTSSFVITPERLFRDWAPQTFDQLSSAHFASVADLRPEIVVFGSGARLRFPDASLTRALVEAGIGLEVMDTGAACRTYNLLVSEGRRVAGALLMIGN